MPLREQLLKLRGSTLARNSAWMFMGQGMSVVIQAGYFFVLARLLGSVEYGVLVGSFALVMMFSQYSNFGSGLIFMRYVSLDRKTFPLYWGNILFTTLTFGLHSCYWNASRRAVADAGQPRHSYHLGDRRISRSTAGRSDQPDLPGV